MGYFDDQDDFNDPYLYLIFQFMIFFAPYNYLQFQREGNFFDPYFVIRNNMGYNMHFLQNAVECFNLLLSSSSSNAFDILKQPIQHIGNLQPLS